ncbi:MAG: Cysteine-rich secretory protein family [Candidatus Parcubacteria bacterium]
MLKANCLSRMFARSLTTGLAISLLTIALAGNIQAQEPPGGVKISSNQASFNYTICTKSQNRDVLADISASTEAQPQTGTVLAQFTSFPLPKDKPTSLNGDTVFSLVNSFRANRGLPAFEKDPNLCELAVARAQEAYNELQTGKVLHSGLYNRNLPYWVTENVKYGPSEQDALNWWIGSPIHYKALISDAKYSCGACYDNVCVELFTSYTPK